MAGERVIGERPPIGRGEGGRDVRKTDPDLARSDRGGVAARGAGEGVGAREAGGVGGREEVGAGLLAGVVPLGEETTPLGKAER